MAKTILSRLGVSEGDSAEVQQLIANHLCMYEMATRRDFEDPQTISDLCGKVREPQVLQDRPALLFCLSNALQRVGLSIWFAKINTEGERVIDVFYVSSGSGQKVLDTGEIERIRVSVLAAVQRLEALILGPGVAATAAS